MKTTHKARTAARVGREGEVRAVNTWDFVVVGAGLVGSAAAKYLARSGARVAVIGPPEPDAGGPAEVFASHYDQGRVQRLIGFDDLWTRLCVETAQVWPQLEQSTGITVHDPVGWLYLSPSHDEYLDCAPAMADQFDLCYESVDGAGDVARIVPQLHVPGSVVGLFERGAAGSINPRAVVRAQLQAARDSNGVIVRDVVASMRRCEGVTELRTTTGEVHRAGAVVVAAGSFTNASGLLPRPLDVQVKGETVILAEVSSETAAELSSMPSVHYEVESETREGIYLIKPLRYPDDRFYLKLGMNQAVDPALDDLDALQAWFLDETTDDGSLARLKHEVTTLFPEVPFRSFRTKRCVISRTVGRRPYLGEVSPRLRVAMGCNGYSAMASDAQAGSRRRSHSLAGCRPNTKTPT